MEDYKKLFLLNPDITYLNHGSFGGCPKEIMDKYFSSDNRLVSVHFVNGRLITDWQITDTQANRVEVYIEHTNRRQRNLLKLPDTEQKVLFTIEDGIITKANPSLRDNLY